jgi:hypothetical protein
MSPSIKIESVTCAVIGGQGVLAVWQMPFNPPKWIILAAMWARYSLSILFLLRRSRTLAIEENAQFEGMSRRSKNAIDISRVQTNRSPPQAAIDGNGKGNGTSHNLNPAS